MGFFLGLGYFLVMLQTGLSRQLDTSSCSSWSLTVAGLVVELAVSEEKSRLLLSFLFIINK